MFWDDCAEREAAIINIIAKDLFQMQGQNNHRATYRGQGDISNICQFRWYEWVYTRDDSEQFPLITEILGRCLGPASNEGN